MRVFLVCALLGAVAALGLVGSVSGCTDLGVGRKCLATGTSQGDGGVVGTKIGSPSLECISRLCYQQQGMNGQSDRLYCTARCVSDDDCKGGITSKEAGRCQSNFVCAIAATVGDFACQSFCICQDDLVNGINQDPVDGGVICPQGCRAFKDPVTGQTSNKCPIGK